jgi:glycerol uptake facilitator protein
MTERGARRWSWQQSLPGELVAEFLGTLIIIAFGDGVVAMVVAALPESGRSTTAANSANWVLISFGWGLPWPSRCGWPAASAVPISIRR